MQIKDYPYQKLPFSNLYKTYLDNFSQLEDFYEVSPFDFESIRERAERVPDTLERSRLADLLTDFNHRFNVDNAALDNIRRLEDERALTIVTGQQLGMYGGPVYTAYKTLTAIQLSRKLEKKLKRPVIPVFWLADEDHDYEEINHITVLNRNEHRTIRLPGIHDHRPPVSELVFSDSLESFREKVRETVRPTDFTDELWEILDSCYQKGIRFDQAFGNLIARLFSRYGLILAGSNNRSVKQLAAESLKAAITSVDQIRQTLDLQSEKIKSEFRQQVTLYDSNLFYLDEPGRVKIIRNGNYWKTDTGQQWKTDDLVEEIDNYPERFSPNVFLRPVLQDKILPTLGYVAGPGETAYYGQMKNLYRSFNLKMPVIFPRLSATIVEPAIDRIIKELPFELHEYNNRIEDLETGYVNRTEQVDIEAIFGEWKEKAETLAKDPAEKIKDIDPTLEGAVWKVNAVYQNELDKLKGKVYRAVKKQDQIQLNRIRRIKARLFPAGGLQERSIAAMYYMNKYGVDIWDRILEHLDEEESFRHHKLIYI